MQSHHLRNRLGKLESALQRKAPNDERQSKSGIKTTFENAMKTMHFRDREEFVQIMESWMRSATTNPRTIIPPIVEHILETTLHKPPRPLYYGPEVFQTCRDLPSEMNDYECEECGCMYPREVLDECQLCGGHVGKRQFGRKPSKTIQSHVYNEVQIRLLNL